jgi:hypothetical protein
MRKYYTILFLFISLLAFSQNNGINFQGVGRNSTGAVLATQKISLRFSVIQGSETGSVEYVESKEVTTNAQGIFSVVIGDGTQISKTGNFTDINWKINPKFLRVEMDPAGGSSFAAMGTTRLQSVPFAYYANGVNADNVDGVLSASKGGTGVASISALKTALGVDQVNNTSDIAKPISTATQAALDTKVSTATFSTTVATKANATDLALKANATDVALKAPLESPTFTGTVSGITKAMVGLSNVANTADLAKPISTATQEALDTKVSTATFSTTMTAKANVADVELKANASDLALKAPLESPTFTGTVSGITKAMVGLSNVANTADLAKPISTATQEALDTKVSTATFSSTVATKENAANKSTATDLGAGATSDILFPTQKAVKTYVDTQVNAGGVANGGITTIKLADAAVTDEKVATGIDKAKVGLANVDNTADVDKPISTATQEALDEKLSTMVFDDRLRNIAKLDESNYFTSEQNIFSGNQIVIGELTLPNGILNLSAGTQILSGIDSPTTIQNRANKDFTIRTNTTFEDEDENVIIRDHELKFTADGELLFSDGSRIFPYLSDQEFESNELRNIFSIRSKTGGYIELKTTSEEEYHYWTFKDDGKITFPDRSTTMGLESYPSFSMFELKSPFGNGISLFAGDPELGSFGGINIIRESEQYDIELRTNNPESEHPNIWKYDSQGMLTFPDGTTLGKFILNEDFSAFEINSPTSIILQSSQTFEDETTLNAGIDIIQGTIIMRTHDLDSDRQENIWQFDSQGVLSFPDGTIMGQFVLNEEPQIFNINSYNGISLAGGNEQPNGDNKSVNLLISSPEEDEQGKLQIITRRYESDIIENKWTYDSEGMLTFPDGTTLAGNYSGSTYFELTGGNNDGFKIINGDDPANPKTWTFGLDGNMIFPGGDYIENDTYRFGITTENKRFQVGISDSPNMSAFYWTFGADGKLEFPDGSKFGAPEGEGTTGFSASDNTSFLIETNSTSNNSTTFNAWNFTKDGALVFPGGTITSGTISGTVNFGFDTRASENGFSILTGTSSSSTKVWTFGTDGYLTLPQGGDIKDQNGNSVLIGMRFMSIEHNPNQDIINTKNNIYDANGFRSPSEQILDVHDGYTITLDHTPLSLDHVSLYKNGVKVIKSKYYLNNNQIIFRDDQINQSYPNYLVLLLSSDDLITIDYFY